MLGVLAGVSVMCATPACADDEWVHVRVRYVEAEQSPRADELRHLDAEVVRFAANCKAPASVNGRIFTSLELATLPRADYQLIGSRMETLRTYLMDRHGMSVVDVRMETSDVRNGAARPPADGLTIVTIRCGG